MQALQVWIQAHEADSGWVALARILQPFERMGLGRPESRYKP
jgi:hypothetical protein